MNKRTPIYPKEDVILGEKVFRSLSEVDCQVDLVNIFRKPDFVMNVVEEAIQRKDVKTIWTQKGIVNNNAAELAKKHDMNVVQNMCTMVEHKNLLV